MKNKKNIILDLDTGIDDAVALVYGANDKNLNLDLITTVHGNVELNKVVKNTLVILEDINRTDVKVVIGEESPVDNDDYNFSAHGKDGLGYYSHPVKLRASKENYIKAIHNVVQKNKMTYIVACGPLTNIAKFIEAHPEDNEKISLVIVSGLLEVDSQNPYINFNIRKDMTAFEIALNSYKNIIVVPSDMGHLGYISQEDFYKTEKCGRIGKILASIYPFHLDRTVKNGAAMHDLCGVLWLSNPEIFTTVDAKAKIVKVKKGAYLNFDLNAKKPNIKLAINMNVKKMHKLYYKMLKSLK